MSYLTLFWQVPPPHAPARSQRAHASSPRCVAPQANAQLTQQRFGGVGGGALWEHLTPEDYANAVPG